MKNKKTLINSLIVLIIFFSIPWLLQIRFSSKLEFDSKKWKQENSTLDDPSLRSQMIEDLVENVLPDKSKKEIEELLGPSLETNYFKSSNKDFIYYLGIQQEGFIRIDSDWLLIFLDKDNKFKSYKIVQD